MLNAHTRPGSLPDARHLSPGPDRASVLVRWSPHRSWQLCQRQDMMPCREPVLSGSSKEESMPAGPRPDHDVETCGREPGSALKKRRPKWGMSPEDRKQAPKAEARASRWRRAKLARTRGRPSCGKTSKGPPDGLGQAATAVMAGSPHLLVPGEKQPVYRHEQADCKIRRNRGPLPRPGCSWRRLSLPDKAVHIRRPGREKRPVSRLDAFVSPTGTMTWSLW